MKMSDESPAQAIVVEQMPGQKKSHNKSLLQETWDFLKIRKAWWLTPIIIMLVLVGVLIIFSQSSSVSPFIYALF